MWRYQLAIKTWQPVENLTTHSLCIEKHSVPLEQPSINVMWTFISWKWKKNNRKEFGNMICSLCSSSEKQAVWLWTGAALPPNALDEYNSSHFTNAVYSANANLIKLFYCILIRSTNLNEVESIRRRNLFLCKEELTKGMKAARFRSTIASHLAIGEGEARFLTTILMSALKASVQNSTYPENLMFYIRF